MATSFPVPNIALSLLANLISLPLLAKSPPSCGDVSSTTSDAGDTMFKALTDANCFLYYDNSLKLRTMTDGIENRGHSYPEVDNTYDLGTSALRWRYVYIRGGFNNAGYVYSNLTPSSNNTYDLGTTSNRWRNVYTNDLHLSNKGHTNDVDGSWGDWTIQEGESDLFLKNNRSGKKYKFNLTEVS